MCLTADSLRNEKKQSFLEMFGHIFKGIEIEHLATVT